MDKVFLTILNMSLTGAFVIAAICLARLPLKKAPKIISYCLWAIAGFRLIFPFSIESAYSLLPINARTIPTDIATQSVPRIDSGITAVNNAVSSVLSAAPTASSNSLQVWTIIGSYVWLVGAAVMLFYGILSYLLLKHRMRAAIHVSANIYEADNIQSPFLMGILSPKIYLLTGLSDQERKYILLHEQTHLRRHDHIVKFGAYFILCLHWFNPLAWIAFLLMGADMEMSCDERVLKELGGTVKKDYSHLLLSLATEKRMIGGSPLAFGEGGIAERIKNILNFRKPSGIIVTTAIILVVALSVGFAMNRSVAANEPSSITIQSGNTEIPYVVDKNKWGNAIYDHIDGFETILSDITVSQLVHVQNGEDITIRFHDTAPDSATLSEFILNNDGTQKYRMQDMTYEIHFDNAEHTGKFTIEPNYITLASSYLEDYEPGNTIKGYRLICSWGNNECEYSFVIRGDAGTTKDIIGILPEDLDVPESVLYAAMDWVQGDYNGLQDTGRKTIQNSAEFDNWRLEYLEHAYTYDEQNIDIYRFEWRLHTTTPDVIQLVGGMDLDEDGWLLDTYSNSWYLIFDNSGAEPVFLFAMMENDCAPGDEMFTADMSQKLNP